MAPISGPTKWARRPSAFGHSASLLDNGPDPPGRHRKRQRGRAYETPGQAGPLRVIAVVRPRRRTRSTRFRAGRGRGGEEWLGRASSGWRESLGRCPARCKSPTGGDRSLGSPEPYGRPRQTFAAYPGADRFLGAGATPAVRAAAKHPTCGGLLRGLGCRCPPGAPRRDRLGSTSQAIK